MLATISFTILILMSFTLFSQTLGYNSYPDATEKRLVYYNQHPLYYTSALSAPSNYATSEYSRAQQHYSRLPNFYYSTHYGRIQPNDDADKRMLFGGFFSRPAPIRDFVSQLVLKQYLFRIPALKAASNTGSVCHQGSSGEYGTCFTRLDCIQNGGQVGSRCGFGTFCCTGVTVSKCGAEISLNNTYWSPPSSLLLDGVSACSATLKLGSSLLLRQGNSICQVRLDFVQFDIAQPTGTKCTSDAFQVSGASNAVPDVCGSNAGQHMYLHVSSSQIQLNFNLQGSGRKNWKIKISQIPCSSSYLAPSDCLQYYSGPSTSVSSFYSQIVTLGRSARPRNLMNVPGRRYPARQGGTVTDVPTVFKPTATPTRPTGLPTLPSVVPTTSTTGSSTVTSTASSTVTESSTVTTESSTSATESSTSTESSTLSTESSTLSTESSTSATESSTLSTESSTLSTESSTLSTESSTLSTESSTLSTESSTSATESSTSATESSTSATESSTFATDSTVSSTESPTLTSTETYSTATSLPTTTTTTQAPVRARGHVYRKIKLGDQDVKICYRTSV